MQREILAENELAQALQALNDWTVDGILLIKSIKFNNFAEALSFVNKVAELAEAADHHPDITFGWGYANIALTTHDRGGITDVDVALAGKIDNI